MTIAHATLHDVRGTEIQFRLDKRVIATFPYADAAERTYQLSYAEGYVRKAIKDGAKIKLKPGVEVHTK